VKKLSFLLGSLIILLVLPAGAQAEDCRFEKQIDLKLDVSESEVLTVIAGAGKLVIVGATGLDEVVIKGTACASKQEWLDETVIEIRDGDIAKIEVGLPDTDSGWSFLTNRYAYLHLELVVPDKLRLDVVDSSGNMTLENVGELSVKDSSGSIKIKQVNGSVTLKDSSGSISLANIEGDVTVLSDGSGSIFGSDITGSVLVKKDSSGGIRFEDVGGDFIVEKDSSGSIIAERIGGDFRVLQDTSGGIRFTDVAGEVSVPKD